MRLNHLTNTEIQTYLDNESENELSRQQVSVHLTNCTMCSEEVADYGRLYAILESSETDTLSDAMINSIMMSLPDPTRGEFWRTFARWTTHLLSVVLFIGIVSVPFDLGLPSISIPMISWAVFADLPLVASAIDTFKVIVTPEKLSLYLFVLLSGVFVFNLERILFASLRQRA